jgi:predicted O-methyltransferase YrrM
MAKIITMIKNFIWGWLYEKEVMAARVSNIAKLDLDHRLLKEASDQSFDYLQNHMRHALCFPFFPKYQVLNYSLNQIKHSGLILEFGVFKGVSISLIAKKLSDKKIHGFDSFQGLPHDWNSHTMAKGTFSVNGKLPNVPKNVELHKGLFDKTLPSFVRENIEKVAFVHIDGDLYSSTKTILDLIGDKIQKGTIIVFGAYINHPNWKENEFKAFQEFVKQSNVTYKYLAVGRNATCIEITSILEKVK